MLKNVGTMDAYLRVTGGLMLLAFGAAAMVRRPGLSQVLIIGLGAAKVAEGITRYDPMMHAIGWSTVEKKPAAEIADRVSGVMTQGMDDPTRATNRIARKAEEYLS